MVKGCYKYRFFVPTFAQHMYFNKFGSFTFSIEVIVLDIGDSEALQETICTSSDIADEEDETDFPDYDSDDDTDSGDDPACEEVSPADFTLVVDEIEAWLEKTVWLDEELQLAYEEVIELQLGPSASQFGQECTAFEDFVIRVDVNEAKAK